jgi:predicted nucleic acid-binding protein
VAVTTLYLDTSGYSHFVRGNRQYTEAIQQADKIYVNPIVLGELYYGFSLGRNDKVNRKNLETFLDFPYVVVHPITTETSERYAYIFRYLKTQGRPIPMNDLWIAASVMELGAVLLTSDRHFLNVPQIQVKILVPDHGDNG